MDKIMQGICLIGIILLLFIIAGNPVFAADPEQLTAIESQIDSFARIFNSYAYPIMSFIGAPYLSWRVTQWFKLSYKRYTKGKKKPHWMFLDAFSWLIVFALSFRAWIAHNGDIQAALYIALTVSFTHSAIVKALFKHAPKQIAEALQYGVSPDDSTILAATVFGRDLRKGKRIPDFDNNDQTQPR